MSGGNRASGAVADQMLGIASQRCKGSGPTCIVMTRRDGDRSPTCARNSRQGTLSQLLHLSTATILDKSTGRSSRNQKVWLCVRTLIGSTRWARAQKACIDPTHTGGVGGESGRSLPSVKELPKNHSKSLQDLTYTFWEALWRAEISSSNASNAAVPIQSAWLTFVEILGRALDETEHTEQAEIQRQINRIALLPGHSLFSQSSSVRAAADQENEMVDGGFAAALQRMGLDEELEDEFEEDFPFAHNVAEQDWFLHGSRTMFMLDLLDNLPKLRLPNDYLKAIIWVMQECKTPNVSSFSALRKKQSSLTGQVDIKTEHHTSSLGNHFYMNHPSKLLALARLGKPAGPIYESWQDRKWTTEVSDDDLSPLWVDWTNTNKSQGHFYIKELNFKIDAMRTRRIPVLTLEPNYLDLCTCGAINFSNGSVQYSTPHPLQAKAQGCPMFRLHVMPWSDDVSGNVSKQYNTHTNICPKSILSDSPQPHCTLRRLSYSWLLEKIVTRNAGGRAQRNEADDQWVSDKGEANAGLLRGAPIFYCSDPTQESAAPCHSAINRLGNVECLTQPGCTETVSGQDVPGAWHGEYDCELEQEILFEIIPHVLPADNLVGGTKEYLETNISYTALYNSGVKDKISQYWIQWLHEKVNSTHHTYLTDPATRDVRLKGTALKGDVQKAVKEEIKHRIQLELWAWLLRQPDDNFASLALNDTARLDLRPGVHSNILLRTRGVDPHRDTPIEILHSYLLGNNKYVWHDTTKQWDDQKQNLFAARLSASSIDSLSIPPPRLHYIVKYKNSLIGKHFKMLQQLGATGDLGALLWFPEIKNMDVYLVDIKALVSDGKVRFGSGSGHLFPNAEPEPEVQQFAEPEPELCVQFSPVQVRTDFPNRTLPSLALVDNGLDLWGLIDPQGIIIKGKLHTFLHIPEDILSFGPAILYATEIFECWKVHSEEARFILNMHALHNAHLIREVLPQTLTAPVPYLNHTETKAKTQATRVRNRTNKEAIASAQEERQCEENDLDSKSDPEERDGENENGENGGDAMELDG
ncbi:hypothetical protein B0H10DRAFT_2272325 [Mycena sp. CBHHK59/15]|nr:hypothetical protein B0H10DRAFT_2272325 [Mycena sp. CBHHK59/15]